MFLISKLFTSFFLPPGIFILALFIASFYAKRFRKTLFAISFIFLLISIKYVANILLSPLESPYNKPFQPQKGVQAVVVLAGGSVYKAANLPLAGSSFKRFVYGLMIAKRENLPLIYTGINAFKRGEEDFAIKQTVQELNEYLHLNIPVSSTLKNEFCVIFEKRSVDTYRNALFTKKLFEENGIKNPKIYLVTSAYHMKRSEIIFKNTGFEVTPEATDFLISKVSHYTAFLPNMGGFQLSFVAIHEYFGILKAILLRGMEL
ncbi:MAG: YdcF family protein [Epsilonproteobacteria bacterium]|nr:YdcF family protein [Campylobacterota bacterium]